MGDWDSYDDVTSAASDDMLMLRDVSDNAVVAAGKLKEISVSDLLGSLLSGVSPADIGAAAEGDLTAEVTRAEAAEAALAGAPLAGVTVVAPSGTDDTAAINAALAGGGVCQLGQGTYYISAPVTPASGSALIGVQGGWGSADDFYTGGSGAPTGTVIETLASFVGEAAILIDNETATQLVGPLLRDIYLECTAMPNQTANWSVSGAPYNGHGIAVYGYWGAGQMERVTVHKCQGVGFLFDSAGTGHPDNWVVRSCKASAARGGTSAVANGYDGYGFMVNWAADCVFSDCESSENGSDNWFVNDNANGQFANCKGENSYGGCGWHFQSGGAMGNGGTVLVTGCQSNANAAHGFLFDTDGGSGAHPCTYSLAGCKAGNEGNSDNGGFTAGDYAGFMMSDSPDRVLLTGCFTDATLATATMKYGIAFAGTCWGALVHGGNYAGAGVSGFAALNVAAGATVTSLPAASGSVVSSQSAAGSFPFAVTSGAVALTDAATIAVDASLGNHFRVTLAGNRTMGAPSNPADGQKITFEITQDATGSRTITWDAAYSFGGAGAPALTTTASGRDLAGFVYSSPASKWLYAGSQLGF